MLSSEAAWRCGPRVDAVVRLRFSAGADLGNPPKRRWHEEASGGAIPGDGIGPEVTAAVKRVLAAADAPIEWIEQQAGLAALEAGQDVLPQDTLDAIERYHFALKGPCTTPVGEGFTSVNVQLRKRLMLYAACVRYATSRACRHASTASI